MALPWVAKEGCCPRLRRFWPTLASIEASPEGLAAMDGGQLKHATRDVQGAYDCPKCDLLVGFTLTLGRGDQGRGSPALSAFAEHHPEIWMIDRGELLPLSVRRVWIGVRVFPDQICRHRVAIHSLTGLAGGRRGVAARPTCQPSRTQFSPLSTDFGG